MEEELAQELRRSKPDADNADAMQAAGRLATRIQERTATIEEVLKLASPIGDLESAEVNDQLQKLLGDMEFLNQLQQSREAASALTGGDVTSEDVEEAYNRAVELSQVSKRLDDLYQQLIAPRLARLRDLEKEASRLAGQLRQSTGESPLKAAERKAEIAALLQELEMAGLKELAELLDPLETTDKQIEEMLRRQSTNNVNSPRVNAASTAFALNPTAGRVELLVSKLRQRIQDAILAEISADRHAPVPTQYRELVDGYFQTLAREADATSDRSGK